MDKQPDPIAPETVNAEQEDAEAQAQSFTEDAFAAPTAKDGLSDTEKAKGGLDDEPDVPDLVDHMKQMNSSGRIDMDAYRGEDSHDDLENRYGTDGAPDAEFAGDDS